MQQSFGSSHNRTEHRSQSDAKSTDNTIASVQSQRFVENIGLHTSNFEQPATDVCGFRQHKTLRPTLQFQNNQQIGNHHHHFIQRFSFKTVNRSLTITKTSRDTRIFIIMLRSTEKGYNPKPFFTAEASFQQCRCRQSESSGCFDISTVQDQIYRETSQKRLHETSQQKAT